jgi:effector-binding domain-containing protein
MKTYEIEAVTTTEQPTAMMRTTLVVGEIGPWLGRAYSAVAASLTAQGTYPVGPPFARYHRHQEGQFDVEAGFPVAEPIKPDGDVQPSSLPGGTAAKVMYVGPYDGMQPVYEALASWVEERGHELAGDPWEVYLSEPSMEPDSATWRTQIVQPYRPQMTQKVSGR